MTGNAPQSSKEKLEALRAVMAARGLDGYIVPHTDEFQCEYTPESANRLEWLTGFTGSAGEAVVLKDKAVAMSDGRYTIQIKDQVDAAVFEIADMGEMPVRKWIAANAPAGAKIGYDPMLHTARELAAMKKIFRAKKIDLIPVEGNLIDPLWQGRPAVPASTVELFPDTVAGRTAGEKTAQIATDVKKAGGRAVIITKPESVAWMLNIRGTDVKHTPLALSYAIVHDNAAVDWFIEPSRVPADVRQHLGVHVSVRAPSELPRALDDLARDAAAQEKMALVDFDRSPVWFKDRMEKAGAEVEDFIDPCVEPRAVKTPQEQDSIRDAHVRDGVAMVRFLKWLDEEAPKGGLTELDVAAKLESIRRVDSTLRDLSFSTIAGWAENGAIVHYRATDESHAAIMPPGILLLDSGGQYAGGTTDITRTIHVGGATPEMKENFTLVLMGHIDIATARFPSGTRGIHLDAFARQALWDEDRDYAHGTGHGVGCYLGVHEDASGIAGRPNEKGLPMKPGMLISNEPGFYKEGEYGIRIESLVLVKEDGAVEGTNGKRKMMAFETVTLCPIDRRLIVPEMMTDGQLQWLNDYHDRVYKTLASRLEDDVKAWLRQATSPLKKNLNPAPSHPPPGFTFA